MTAPSVLRQRVDGVPVAKVAEQLGQDTEATAAALAAELAATRYAGLPEPWAVHLLRLDHWAERARAATTDPARTAEQVAAARVILRDVQQARADALAAILRAVERAECWATIDGFPDYQASDRGRVRSLARTITRSDGAPLDIHARILAAHPNGRGYLKVTLYRDGEQHTRPVHGLVAAAFHGPRPEGLEVRHLDGDKLNNRADNLAYGTRSDNARDAVRHGTHRNARKTRCPAGHDYDAANTYRRRGGRACRECHRINDRDRKRAIRADRGRQGRADRTTRGDRT